MSFHLYVSDDLDTLAAELARLIRAPADPARMPDPFFRETVTVPNQARLLAQPAIAAITASAPHGLPYPALHLPHVFNLLTGKATAQHACR